LAGQPPTPWSRERLDGLEVCVELAVDLRGTLPSHVEEGSLVAWLGAQGLPCRKTRAGHVAIRASSAGGGHLDFPEGLVSSLLSWAEALAGPSSRAVVTFTPTEGCCASVE
jgi:hypothetical protein